MQAKNPQTQKPRRKLISLIFFCSSHSMMCIVSGNWKNAHPGMLGGVEFVNYHAFETGGAHVLTAQPNLR